MWQWLTKRLFQALLVIVAMTIIVFIGVNMIGNSVDILISPDADQAERLRVIHQLGLDQPLWRQYLAFVNGALHGNLGDSYVYSQPALQVILQRFPATFELAVTAMVFSIIIGIPLGLYVGLRPQSPLANVDGRQHSRFFAADILGWPDADYGVRRSARLAAVQRPRCDSDVAVLPVVISHSGRLTTPHPAGDQCVAGDALDTRRRAGSAAAGLYPQSLM